MHNRGDIMIRLLSAIYGLFVGAFLGLLMVTPVLLTDTISLMWWPSGRISGMLIAWVGCGAIYGFGSGFVIQIIGEMTGTTRKKRPCCGSNLSEAPLSKRQLLRMRRFWLPFFAVLALAPVMSLFTYWQTYQAWKTDGCEQIGWPFSFFARGGFAHGEYYYLKDLTIDIAIWITIATLVGLTVRDGVRRFSIKCLLFLRNFLGASKR